MFPVDKQILFLLTRVPTLSVQRFVEIYTARGYSAQSIRNALSRLKQQGYVETPERSTYAITDYGRRTQTAISSKGVHYGEQWNGEWHMVTFEIPERDRKTRYQLRNLLNSLGFAALHQSTYISPWNYTELVAELAAKLDIRPYVTQMRGILHSFALTPEQAGRMWNLDSVRAAHEAKWQWFEHIYLPEVNRNREAKDALQLFIRYLELGEAMGELVILDPMLPPQFLPDDWKGSQILDAFYGIFSTLHRDVPADADYYPLMLE